ncbi:MAG: hypothetical protein AUI14_06130 [Actinobacteria bacterium 13_2_20CM_2_71_6]|nr:MAG: hypothetical protein AUI14_06130 [Actinobacteria bacterium 13_2_20CM_2_71_6]
MTLRAGPFVDIEGNLEGVRELTGSPNVHLPVLLDRCRQEAVDRMVLHARRRGANAVVGMRFDHREISQMWVEICAYGTAVVITAADRVRQR